MMKKTLLKKMWVGIIFLLNISSHALAHSQLISEFRMNLPRQFVQEVLEKRWETLTSKEFQGNWKFSDQEIRTLSVPIKISDISLTLKTLLHKPSVNSDGGALDLMSDNLQLQLHIGEVAVDQVLERTIGGVTGHFKIQARCRNNILSLLPGQGGFTLQLSPLFHGSKMHLAVNDMDLFWNKGSWKWEGSQCEGAEGFFYLLQQEVEQMISNSHSFIQPRKEVLKKYIEESIQPQELDFTGASQISTERSDIRAAIVFDEGRPNTRGFYQLKGRLFIDFFQDTQDNAVLHFNADSTTMKNSNSGQLRLPKGFINEFVKKAYAPNTWAQRVLSSKLPDFNTLLNSRFLQFFLWPELMSFSKRSIFLFDVYSNKNIFLNGDGFHYFLKATLLAKMWAPKNGKYVSFMNFTIPIQTALQFNIENGKLLWQTSALNLNLYSAWDSSYVDIYNTSPRFARKTLQNQLVKKMNENKGFIELPKIPLMEGVFLKIDRAQVLQDKSVLFLLSP